MIARMDYSFNFISNQPYKFTDGSETERSIAVKKYSSNACYFLKYLLILRIKLVAFVSNVYF